MIEADKLTEREREELTAQAERDAGIVPQEAADKPERVPDIGDVYDVARDVMSVIRATLEVPEGFTVEFRLTEGLCELEVADAVEPEKMVTLTWR